MASSWKDTEKKGKLPKKDEQQNPMDAGEARVESGVAEKDNKIGTTSD